MTDLRIDEMVEVAEVVADVAEENVVENVVKAGLSLNKKACIVVGVVTVGVAVISGIGVLFKKKKAKNAEEYVESTDNETEEETTEDSETEN